jgi:hypothetical protein
VLSGSEHIGAVNGIIPYAANTNDTRVIPTAKLHSNQCTVNGSMEHRTVNGFTNGHSPHLHNGAHHNTESVIRVNGTSSSADEHEDSILLAQGYDSMCFEAMTQPDMAENFYWNSPMFTATCSIT